MLRMDKISIGCSLIFAAVLGMLVCLVNIIWLWVCGAVFLAGSVLVFWGVLNGEYSKGRKRQIKRKAA